MRFLAAALPFTRAFPVFFFARFLAAGLFEGRLVTGFFLFFATFLRRVVRFFFIPALLSSASAAAVPPIPRGIMSVATFYSNLVNASVEHTLLL